MSGITIRRAGPGDAPALARLAALDSSHAPAGEVLVVEVAGELRAALGLADGHVIADPFRRTAELVSMLRMRAGQLAAHAEPGRGRRRVLRPAARSA
jgi:hypothetical protein